MPAIARRPIPSQSPLGARAARPPLFTHPHLTAAGTLLNLPAHLGCKTRRRHGLSLHNTSPSYRSHLCVSNRVP